ncbi:MAG: ABC transporter substrate-binding protein, partial [Olsenella sp.]
MNNFVNRPLSRRAFVGGASAAAALGLAACGSSSTSSSSSSSSSTASTGTEGGGTIAAGSAYAPSSFNPASTGSAIGIGANWHVVEGLYGIDYHDYTTFPELATGDPKQVDDTTFEVTLRDGASFSDGNAVTPDDVVASFNRAVAGKLY